MEQEGPTCPHKLRLDDLVWGCGETAGLEGTTWVPVLGLLHFLALEAGTHLQLLQMWEESDLPQGLW